METLPKEVKEIIAEYQGGIRVKGTSVNISAITYEEKDDNGLEDGGGDENEDHYDEGPAQKETLVGSIQINPGVWFITQTPYRQYTSELAYSAIILYRDVYDINQLHDIALTFQSTTIDAYDLRLCLSDVEVSMAISPYDFDNEIREDSYIDENIYGNKDIIVIPVCRSFRVLSNKVLHAVREYRRKEVMKRIRALLPNNTVDESFGAILIRLKNNDEKDILKDLQYRNPYDTSSLARSIGVLDITEYSLEISPFSTDNRHKIRKGNEYFTLYGSNALIQQLEKLVQAHNYAFNWEDTTLFPTYKAIMNDLYDREDWMSNTDDKDISYNIQVLGPNQYLLSKK